MTLPSNVRRRLSRLERAGSPTAELIPTPPCPPGAAEAAVLAEELKRHLRQMLAAYQRTEGLSVPDAAARVLERFPGLEEQTLNGPADEVTWDGLMSLGQHDPERFVARWEELKRAARHEAEVGLAASKAVEDQGDCCWQRASFLATRAELIEAWRPRNGLERQLLDQMAQGWAMVQRWQEVVVRCTYLAAVELRRPPERKKRSDGRTAIAAERTLSAAERTDEAMRMVERWQKFYLRALEALQRLRRGPASVVVRRAGQVNVGRNQVNIARP